MQKINLIFLVGLMSILLIGCGKEAPQQANTVLSSSSPSMCANVIKDYLAKADTKGKAGTSVKK